MTFSRAVVAAALMAVLGTAFAAPATADASAVTAAVPTFNLDADVSHVLKTFGVPGIAVAVVKDGRIVAAKGYGVRKLGEPNPVDGKTLFEVASNSKAFTAAALAMLVDEGKIAWDDPVTQHLPGFQMFDAYATSAMTVRDLLTHRSGLGLGAGDLLWWPGTDFSIDETISRLRYVRPATSFRGSHAYNNLMYIVAGKIIAEKDGKPWGQAIRDRILTPLGMNRTTTSVAEMLASADHAAPHGRIDDKATAVKPMPVPNAVGAVGINTSAEDIARWMALLLNEGRTANGTRLLSAKQVAELWTPQPTTGSDERQPARAATKPEFSPYGVGFSVRDYEGRRIAMHGGALQGFYSTIVLVPEEKLGIAILTNAESSAAMTALSWRVLDHYLKVPATDWIKVYAEREAARRAEAERHGKEGEAHAARSSPSLPLASYDGDYEDPWYGKVTIATEGGRRMLRFAHTPELTGELQHFRHDTFIVRWKARYLNADAYVSFALNPDGGIGRMTMAPISSETDFSYDFHDLNFTPATK